MSAAALVGPEPLRRALEILESRQQSMTRQSRSIAHLYVTEPKLRKSRIIRRLYDAHPSLTRRIAVLRSIEDQQLTT